MYTSKLGILNYKYHLSLITGNCLINILTLGHVYIANGPQRQRLVSAGHWKLKCFGRAVEGFSILCKFLTYIRSTIFNMLFNILDWHTIHIATILTQVLKAIVCRLNATSPTLRLQES